MWLTVNVKAMQNGPSRTMVYGVACLVSYLNFTRTPRGVGMGKKLPRFLKAGDGVELGI
jgi:2-keto-4-pentenoate hydratase/2-oxohepta-3-ene-1,7-dioic acid hydratase in catechol pathway